MHFNGTVMAKLSRFKKQSIGSYSLYQTAIYLWCCQYITFLSNIISLSAQEQRSELGSCLLASNAGTVTKHYLFRSTSTLTGENTLYNCITYLAISIASFGEYAVENTHSILCSQTKSSDTIDEFRTKEKYIFQSKDNQSHYRSFVTKPEQFSFSHNQLRVLKVKCAQVLSSMFPKVSQSPGQSLFSSNNRCNTSVPTHVTLPTMYPNKYMKTAVYLQGITVITRQIKQKNVI